MTEVAQGKRCEEAVVLDCISDGVVTIGLDMRIRYMNRAMRELLGCTEDALLGNPLSCNLIVKSEICSTCDCVLERAIRNREKVSNYETVIKNKDGRLIPVMMNTDLLWDEHGELVGVVETYRDVSQIKELKDKLERERHPARQSLLIAKSKVLHEIIDLLPQVANSKATVLIEGESGTGKELIAKEIHRLSPRHDKPFVALNCAALAEGVLESELFGHVKGAFTGAIVDRLGRFELANQGTIFLDEIAEISPTNQVKLLRVLQEEELERVGSAKTIKLNVRVIAASNKDLGELVRNGGFREDLYYRLRVFPIKVPPLRERRDDILPLVEYFMNKFNRTTEKNIRGIDGPTLKFLESYAYPGNVRELQNILEHCFIRCLDHTIRLEHLPQDMQVTSRNLEDTEMGRTGREPALKVLERQMIEETLGRTDWNYQETCRILGISRSTLLRRIKRDRLHRKKVVS